MPRIARVTVEKVFYHVSQYGNNHQYVFHDNDDYQKYLELLAEQSQKYGLKILGWCLMPDHVHLVVLPENSEALTRAIGRTHYYYTLYFNKQYAHSGHLWYNRFNSVPLDRNHAREALRYVDQNPVRANMVQQPWDYEWSSADCHGFKQKKSPLISATYWQKLIGDLNWKKYLKDDIDDKLIAKLRMHTNTGKPLGTASFLNRIEEMTGRKLKVKPRGRPKKIKTKKETPAAKPVSAPLEVLVSTPTVEESLDDWLL